MAKASAKSRTTKKAPAKKSAAGSARRYDEGEPVSAAGKQLVIVESPAFVRVGATPSTTEICMSE